MPKTKSVYAAAILVVFLLAGCCREKGPKVVVFVDGHWGDDPVFVDYTVVNEGDEDAKFYSIDFTIRYIEGETTGHVDGGYLAG